MCFHSFLNPSMVGVEEDNGGGAALNYYDFSDLESFISSNGAKLESINCLAIDDDPATPNQHIYDPLSPFISRNKVKLSSNTRDARNERHQSNNFSACLRISLII